MTWNYRVIDHGGWMAVHEVFYDGQGNPNGYTTEPVSFVVDSEEGLDSLRRSLVMALNDTYRLEVLPVSIFGKHGEVFS